MSNAFGGSNDLFGYIGEKTSTKRTEILPSALVNDMRFTVNKEIFEKFPELRIGLVVAKGIDNKGSDPEIEKMLREIQGKIREKFNKETLSENPKINVWRKAYSLFGGKPKKYKCSVENLYRMVLDGIELKHINKVVDVYNYISLKHMVPLGGDDLDKVEGKIELKIAKGNEKFVQLNSEEVKNPNEGEVIYMDDKDVLCRRWNWRECDKSKMTENTKNVTIVVEGLPPVSEKVEEIIKELSELVQKFCGGTVESCVLDSNNPEKDL
jgi:DNA/RNA-binding domain of Phe-tRNA-synthetase-like protein